MQPKQRNCWNPPGASLDARSPGLYFRVRSLSPWGQCSNETGRGHCGMNCEESEVTPSWNPLLPRPQGFPATISVLSIKIILLLLSGRWWGLFLLLLAKQQEEKETHTVWKERSWPKNEIWTQFLAAGPRLERMTKCVSLEMILSLRSTTTVVVKFVQHGANALGAISTYI